MALSSSCGVRRVAVLFVARNSVYKRLAGVDAYDDLRDAVSFDFDAPVVAHPPCAQWSKLRAMAKGTVRERDLGRYAVRVVRACGGVLEHPEDSALWEAEGLPPVGSSDSFGGFSLRVFQGDFGHYAAKPTWLYFVGVSRELVIELVHARATRMVRDQAAVMVRDQAAVMVRDQGAVMVHSRRTGLVRQLVVKMGRVSDRREKVDREATPLEFAQLLTHLARCSSRKLLPAVY